MSQKNNLSPTGVIVLKFGSSVLRTVHDLSNIVHEIYRWYAQGNRVIAVVSAFGNTTERLIQESQALTSAPEPFSTAELLATGERASAALLGIALDRAGVPARVVSPREIGFEVAGAPLDAEPTALDTERVRVLLADTPVLVVPGFFGTDSAGRTHCLGRGGSDLTAVFLAVSVNARCRLLKDVDGVYEFDPADPGTRPRRLAQVSYEDALVVAGKLIQGKAVTYLQQHEDTCEVAAVASPIHSLISAGPTRVADPTVSLNQPRTPKGRLDVVLLGCGTVGHGVYQRLITNSKHFNVLAVLVQDRPKHQAAGIPLEHLHTRLGTLRGFKPDLVIDALPGLSPSCELLQNYLSEGIDVVTANKTVIAEDGAALTRLARESGAGLRFSAAVGGATPMLEAADRARSSNVPPAGVSAMLNATCNFVLDACARGATLAEGITEAQRLGFAEADPCEDLSGRDAARKLNILTRHALGVELAGIEVHALDDSVAEAARAAAATGQRLRQVAHAERQNGRVMASVSFERVTPESPFFAPAGEWNALTLTLADGEPLTILGRGAGRWPTTEAVMADVFEIVRARIWHRP